MSLEGEFAHDRLEAFDIGIVQRRVDFIEDGKGSRFVHEESKEKRDCGQSLLATRHERDRLKFFAGRLGVDFDPAVQERIRRLVIDDEVGFAAVEKSAEHFDEIHYIDILDCNAGDHGYAFATNFNSEINIREVTAKGKFYENGEWKETEPLAVHKTFDLPEIGSKKAYLMYHEELESLVKNIPGMKRIRFWMTFSDTYLNHLKVLQNVGMTRIDTVEFEGNKISFAGEFKRMTIREAGIEHRELTDQDLADKDK
ncbi:hypothetical protein IIC65_04580, partial [Candidatus Sumerlaeota bacterium]|nr:hypothetical protein [Candidatus Sumerlaeota bacterium]